MISSGTFQPSLTAGAARPSDCGAVAADLGLVDLIAGFTASIHANQEWLWMQDAKPAYPVAHTTRLTRPLGGAP